MKIEFYHSRHDTRLTVWENAQSVPSRDDVIKKGRYFYKVVKVVWEGPDCVYIDVIDD